MPGQPQFSTIRAFLSRLPGFAHPEKFSLQFLNTSQFTGALNDNIYKLILAYYLIERTGPENANFILSLAGAIFVIPFLLFSSFAGMLADRYSKSRIIMWTRGSEIIVMSLAIIAFAFKFTWSSYVILFLISTLGAFFSPSKYGIIPELVPKEGISKANGFITSFTYLAIIAGTFLASFLVDITGRNYIVVGCCCLFISLIGFFSSFGIKYTQPGEIKKKPTGFFIIQIYKTLKECNEHNNHLLVVICSCAFFLFAGSFTQLNIIPFAMQSLGLTEVAGGYLFLTTALGIAFGAYIAGRLSKQQIEPGLSCIAAFLIALFFFVLSASSFKLPLTLIGLVLLGFSGGCFIVPLDAFIQYFSPENMRGNVIAASNFLSFIGVLLASFTLYLFNEIFGFTAATSFFVMGVITVLFALFLILRLSNYMLSYTAKKILFRILSVKTVNLDEIYNTSNLLLMLEEGSFLKAWILFGMLPNMHLLIPQYKVRKFPYFQKIFYSVHRLSSPNKFEDLIEHSKSFREENRILCIYLLKKMPLPEKRNFIIPEFFTDKNYSVFTVNFIKNPKGFEIQFTKK